MKPDKAFFRNLVLYGIIGGVSSGLDALIFALLVKGLGINQFVANTISIDSPPAIVLPKLIPVPDGALSVYPSIVNDP